MLLSTGGMEITSHQQYITDGMEESELEPTPMAMFSKWFQQAVATGVPEPEAMTLSTVAMPEAPAPASRSSTHDKQPWSINVPRPSARIVLLLPRPATGPSGGVVTDLHAKPDLGCGAR